MTKVKKSEEQVLFPEAKVGKIKIKPWSFGILFEISELLEQVIDKVEEKNIVLDEGFISYITMVKLFTLASSQVLTIMSITLDIPEEEISALSMDDGIQIAMIIAKQNWEIVSKNVLNLLPKSEILETEEEQEQLSEEKESQ